MVPAATSFLDALAVPELAQACISVLNTPQQPGSGLKQLRFLSRDALRSIMSMVRSFSLPLAGDAIKKDLSVVEALAVSEANAIHLPSPRTTKRISWYVQLYGFVASKSEDVYKKMSPFFLLVPGTQEGSAHVFTQCTFIATSNKRGCLPQSSCVTNLCSYLFHALLNPA